MLGRVKIRPPSTRPAEDVEDELATLRVEDRRALQRQGALLAEFRALESSLRRK